MKAAINRMWIPIILMIISWFIPGHVRIHFGWLTGFIVYYLVYALISYAYKFQRLPLWLYIIIATLFFLFIPIYTLLDNPALWYPQIMPCFMITGIAGFITGLFFGMRKFKPALGSFMGSIFLVAYINLNIDSYLYNTYVDPKIHKELLEISPELSFVDLNQTPVTAGEFKGKVVILDFWFTGCGICIQKMDTYDSLYSYYKNRNDIIILSVADGSLNSLQEIKEFTAKRTIKCRVVYDKDGVIAKKYQLGKDGYPIELRIGKTGKIEEIIEGFPKPALYYSRALNSIDLLLHNKYDL